MLYVCQKCGMSSYHAGGRPKCCYCSAMAPKLPTDQQWTCPQCGKPCPEGGVHDACKAAFAASAEHDRD